MFTIIGYATIRLSNNCIPLLVFLAIFPPTTNLGKHDWAAYIPGDIIHINKIAISANITAKT
ncbi:hypothetical protein APPUASWS_024640 [Arthrospira platensis str. Paraca]|nr:hypothetical protein APPUASWS_024640 [Arthrospira platensis str. Paraca]